jgi:Flp pilus assembly protein TadB
MKYENSMHRFFQVSSGVSLIIAGISMLKGNIQGAIFGVLLAIHLNMLSWNYGDYDEEE